MLRGPAFRKFRKYSQTIAILSVAGLLPAEDDQHARRNGEHHDGQGDSGDVGACCRALRRAFLRVFLCIVGLAVDLAIVLIGGRGDGLLLDVHRAGEGRGLATGVALMEPVSATIFML